MGYCHLCALLNIINVKWEYSYTGGGCSTGTDNRGRD